MNEKQASAGNLLCKLYTDTHAHAHTNTCSLSSIRGWKPRQWTPQLCHALTYLLVFICWVPQITLTLPQVHKWGHFLRSERLKTFTPSPMCCCRSFFLFRRRVLRFQLIRRKVRWTRRTVPRACRVKSFGPRTQLRCSSSNCPNQVREVQVRPIKNELSSPNFFQVCRTPRTRFAKKMFVQLKTGLTRHCAAAIRGGIVDKELNNTRMNGRTAAQTSTSCSLCQLSFFLSVLVACFWTFLAVR